MQRAVIRCSRRDWRPITGIDLHSRTSARVGHHHHDADVDDDDHGNGNDDNIGIVVFSQLYSTLPPSSGSSYSHLQIMYDRCPTAALLLLQCTAMQFDVSNEVLPGTWWQLGGKINIKLASLQL